MKNKILLLFFFLSMLTAFISCGKDDGNSSSASSNFTLVGSGS